MTPKKELGQHFLTSPQIAQALVMSAEIGPHDCVLEIGPGTGILTKYLLSRAKKVVAVEKDRDLIKNLEEQFKSDLEDKRFVLVEGDIRSFSTKKLKNYILVGNIPYYITGEILETFLSSDNQPKTAVFMVQKEVAERILAKNKKESILSIAIKAYGEPKIIRKVAKGSFHPPPNVESAIIKISSISKDFFGILPESFFFSVLKKGFAHKRKLLIKNLSSFGDKKALTNIFMKLGLSLLIRPEDITLPGWKKIAEELFSIHKKHKGGQK